ncbi:TPA: DUF3265 domain-containing protein [Vibrio vulnificus]|nr:DUF3265 domain-containing protein [Vibrio vulnificus]HDY7717851.1 DUF3265 domain-containing protein [Vibrio vulnificus]
MTRRLSGIHAAWHFWYAVIFGGESVLRKAGLCGIHPLNAALCFYWSALHSVSYGSIIHMLLIGTNESLIKRSLTGCQVQSASHQGKLSR